MSDLKRLDTFITNRYLGRRCGRGKDPNRVSKNRYRYADTTSCVAASFIFRQRQANPRLCWVLVKDGAVLARHHSERELREWKALTGMTGDIQREVANG